MGQEGFKRKLTAILSADAVGYSRLMAEDEVATVETLAAYREAMTSLIKQHRGRVIDSPGDNVLAEFSSVVDAVQCAVAIQNEFQLRNAELTENRRMEFRIGINLGDVIDEEDRIYGDGVNVAARLEAMADPGGICISKTAFDQIETKLPLGYEYLGEQSVKNIPKPVGAYRVLMQPRVTIAGKTLQKKKAPVRLKSVLVGAAVVIIFVIALGIWQFYIRRPSADSASIEKMEYALPVKPSIAVLPFVNMSDSPEQEYFSDGLTEEIITALTKVPKVFVIARNSTFGYKGRSVKVSQVAEELGVRYVLEGSVRRAGDQVRITAQLTDAFSGHHLWAERYDRDLKDIFALQDQITMKVLTALRVVLTEGFQALLKQKEPNSLEAYLKILKGREEWRCQCKEGNDIARNLASEAISLDPEYPAAYYLKSQVHFMDAWLPPFSVRESIALAIKYAQKAIELDPNDALAHGFLGYLYGYIKRYEDAIFQGEKAVKLAPNSSSAHFSLGMALVYDGRYEEAIRIYQKMFRLNPRDRYSAYYVHIGFPYLMTNQYELAISAYIKATQIAPDSPFPYMMLAPTYVLSGQENKAIVAAEKLLERNPEFSVSRYEERSALRKKEDLKRIVEAMRKAGLPE